MAARIPIRHLLGGAFLFGQLCWIIGTHFTDTRYFCWAPNDYMVVYHLDVRVKGRALTQQEIQQRYRVCCRVYQNIATHLEDILRQYETTYGRSNPAEVTLVHSTNGGPNKTWAWPPK